MRFAKNFSRGPDSFVRAVITNHLTSRGIYVRYYLNHGAFVKSLPAGIALSVLACAINSALAAEVTDLGAVGASDTTNSVPAAAISAPSHSSLSARSAQSVISEDYIRNDLTPAADFSQVIQKAPGMWSVSPNGPGIGQTTTYFRGFADGDYSITFDGIPFQDTNSPTHHTWVFFPSQLLGGAVIDRSPGSAATLGPANFGGSINLLSRNLEPQSRTTEEGSYGSWNTQYLGVEHETGQFGADGSSNLLVTAHALTSDGYQTLNSEKQNALSAKYTYAISNDTALTLFASGIDLHANQPNTGQPTRAQAAQYGYSYLLQNTDPTQTNFEAYNFYHVTTDFIYAGITSNLNDGWKLDDKVYQYAYYNKQNYQNKAATPGTAAFNTAAIDKLNSYNTTGNILRVSKDTSTGILRTGLWSEVASTSRHQTPSNALTWVDAAQPKFNESYITTLLQPFVEYEYKATTDLSITPGVKYASYNESFTQYADASTVGNLGGAPYITHANTYTAVLPSLDAHYMIEKNWSAYAQYAMGSEIPPTNVFDVSNANVTVLPAMTLSKTVQLGTVWQSDSYTLDVDVYHISKDNAYSSVQATVNGVTDTYWYANGTSTSQGFEAESNIVLSSQFSLYVNGTIGSTKYDATGQWAANAPSDTEVIGLNYKDSDWSAGWFTQRIGKMYNDNGAYHQAITIDPFTVSNLFVNYTIKNPVSTSKKAKIQLGINNLFNNQSIVGITAATAGTAAAPYVVSQGDLLTILPQRSATVSLKLDF